MKHFKQSYTQKPVRRYAPDGFVLLNQQGYLESPTGERVNFNDDITSISVSGTVNAPPANASFSISIPRSEYSKYFKNGRPVIFPMMEVKIYLKGRFYTLNEQGTLDVPPPYQQFHGLVKSVSESYSSETHTLNVSCVDLLYWMQITKMNLRPSVLVMENTGAQSVPYVGVFMKKNPKEIIKEIVNFAFGGQRKSAGGTPINAAFVPETFNSISFTGALRSSVYEPVSKKDVVTLQQDIMADYWSKRMGLDKEQDTNFIDLIIFGYRASRGERINSQRSKIDPSDKVNQSNFRSQQTQIESKRDATPQPVAYQTEGAASVSQTLRDVDEAVQEATGTVFESSSFDLLMQQLIDKASPYGQVADVDVMDNSSFSSLFEIATTCKDFIGYEFYMALDGQIVFKPPFYNIDVRPYRPFVIKDEDIFDFQIEESDDVITMLSVRGNISMDVRTPTETQHIGVAFDARLSEKYGVRAQTTDLQMVGSYQEADQAKLLSIYAQNEIDRHNAKRFTATITIPLTPEIKMGYPIYIEEKNCFAYVSGITHSLAFGSSARTTLNLEALRFKSDYGPNMVMRPGAVSPQSSLNKIEHSELSNEKKAMESLDKIKGSATKSDRKRELGKASNTDGDFFSTGVQPITDADGYDLVGVISYGSNLLMDSRGQIQPKKKSLNLDTSNMRLQVTRKLSNMTPTSQSNNYQATPKKSSTTVRDKSGTVAKIGTSGGKQNTSGKGKGK
jgi:hypothetical protein